MTLFDTGRLCVKTAGREAGKLCVVLDKAEKDFVVVTGPRVLTGVRKRKCSVNHLEPLQAKIKMKSDASDSEILDLLKKEESILKKFDLSVPGTEDIKKWEAKRAEREASRKSKAEIQNKKEEAKPAHSKETKQPEKPKAHEKEEKKAEDAPKTKDQKHEDHKHTEPKKEATPASEKKPDILKDELKNPGLKKGAKKGSPKDGL